MTTTTCKDANLYHNLATGRAVTGALHYLNQTPIDWFTKKQETVETATYGSEFAAARTAIQQIAGLRQMLLNEQSAYLLYRTVLCSLLKLSNVLVGNGVSNIKEVSSCCLISGSIE